MYLVLPLPPADTPLDDSDLDAVSGGRKKELQEQAREAAQSADTSSKVGW